MLMILGNPCFEFNVILWGTAEFVCHQFPHRVDVSPDAQTPVVCLEMKETLIVCALITTLSPQTTLARTEALRVI